MSIGTFVNFKIKNGIIKNIIGSINDITGEVRLYKLSI